MEKFDALVQLLDELAEKYQFEDADVARIQEIVFDVENGEDLYGDTYIEDEPEEE